MQPLFANMPEEALVVVAIAVVGGVLIAITAIIVDNYRKIQRDDMTATLKMEMIQRGMSAEEIERVLAARMGSSTRRSPRQDGQRQAEQRHAGM